MERAHTLLQSAIPMVDVRTPLIGAPQRDLLCALAYVYLACGQADRALALLNLIESDGDMDVGILRVLGYALVAAGEGERALEVIDRIEGLDRSEEAVKPMLLLRSHALRLADRLPEARACFQAFTAIQSQDQNQQDQNQQDHQQRDGHDQVTQQPGQRTARHSTGGHIQ